jgi:hypothetical protein
MNEFVPKRKLLWRILPWFPCWHFWLARRPKSEGWVCENCGQMRPDTFKPRNPRRTWSGA